MARNTDIKEIAKQVRAQLKKEFPDHKFSVTIDPYWTGQSMSVNLMTAPESPYQSLLSRPDKYDGTQRNINPDYNQLNHLHIDEDYVYEGQWYSNGVHLTEKAAKMLNRVVEIANQENWDNSDSMIDYFDVNYYFDLSIGKWDKPFEVTGQTVEKSEPETVEIPAQVEEAAPVEVLMVEPVAKPVPAKKTRKTTAKPLGIIARLGLAFSIIKTGKI